MTTPSTEFRLGSLESSAFETGRTLAELLHRVQLIRDGLDLIGEDASARRQDLAEFRRETATALSELSDRVDTGFAGVDAQFARVDAQFAGINAQLAAIAAALGARGDGGTPA